MQKNALFFLKGWFLYPENQNCNNNTDGTAAGLCNNIPFPQFRRARTASGQTKHSALKSIVFVFAIHGRNLATAVQFFLGGGGSLEDAYF